MKIFNEWKMLVIKKKRGIKKSRELRNKEEEWRILKEKKLNLLAEKFYVYSLMKKAFQSWNSGLEGDLHIQKYRNFQVKKFSFLKLKKILNKKKKILKLFLRKKELICKFKAFSALLEYKKIKRPQTLKKRISLMYRQLSLKKKGFNGLKKLFILKKNLKIFLVCKDFYLKKKFYTFWKCQKLEMDYMRKLIYKLQKSKLKRIFEALKENKKKSKNQNEKYTAIKEKKEKIILKDCFEVWILRLRVKQKNNILESYSRHLYFKSLAIKTFKSFNKFTIQSSILKLKEKKFKISVKRKYFESFRSEYIRHKINRLKSRKFRLKSLKIYFSCWVLYTKTSKILTIKFNCVKNERRLRLLRTSFESMKILREKKEMRNFNTELWDSRKVTAELQISFRMLKQNTIVRKNAKKKIRIIFLKKIKRNTVEVFSLIRQFTEGYKEEKRLEKIQIFLTKRFLLRRLLKFQIIKEKSSLIAINQRKKLQSNFFNFWRKSFFNKRMDSYLSEMTNVIRLKNTFKFLKNHNQEKKKLKMALLYSQCVSLKKSLMALEWHNINSKKIKAGGFRLEYFIRFKDQITGFETLIENMINSISSIN